MITGYLMSAFDFAAIQPEVLREVVRDFDESVATPGIHNAGVRIGVGVAVASTKKNIRDTNGNFLPFAVCGKNLGEIFALVGKCEDSLSESAKQVCVGQALLSTDCKRLAEKFAICASWQCADSAATCAVRARKVHKRVYVRLRERANQLNRAKLRKKMKAAGAAPLHAAPTTEGHTVESGAWSDE